MSHCVVSSSTHSCHSVQKDTQCISNRLALCMLSAILSERDSWDVVDVRCKARLYYFRTVNDLINKTVLRATDGEKWSCVRIDGTTEQKGNRYGACSRCPKTGMCGMWTVGGLGQLSHASRAKMSEMESERSENIQTSLSNILHSLGEMSGMVNEGRTDRTMRREEKESV